MRIWDIDPGYLNDKSLLGEHRELHGMINVIEQNKKGYSRHPETLRWKNHTHSLKLRHQILLAEMHLRGFNHKSPVNFNGKDPHWPVIFIDTPDKQYRILKGKYKTKPGGRIPLPGNPQSLWASHKYSVMARSYSSYKSIGQKAANGVDFITLARELVVFLRTPPPLNQLQNALLHMWGYVSSFSSRKPDNLSQDELLHEIQQLALQHKVSYLTQSTALGELAHWTASNQYTNMEVSPLDQ